MEFNAILSPLGAFGPMIGGVLLLLLVVKLLSMPFKLVWNGLCGATSFCLNLDRSWGPWPEVWALTLSPPDISTRRLTPVIDHRAHSEFVWN